jgi:hypothetical protein
MHRNNRKAPSRRHHKDQEGEDQDRPHLQGLDVDVEDLQDLLENPSSNFMTITIRISFLTLFRSTFYQFYVQNRR